VFSEQPTHEERANAFDDNVEAEGEGLDNSIFETNWDESVEKFDDLFTTLIESNKLHIEYRRR
jgi:hypothetical protein